MRTNRRGLLARAGVLVAALALLAAACATDDGSADTAAEAMSVAGAASADAGVAASNAQSASASAAAAQAAADAASASAELAQATATGNQAAVEAAEAALAEAQATAEQARSDAAAAEAEAESARQAAQEAEAAAAAAPMADEPAAESITLEFWSWNNEGAYPVVHEEAEALFEADYPNVDVVRTYTPFADYMTNLRAAIAAGEPPDVAQVPWTGEYTDLVNGGALASLEGEFTTGFPDVLPADRVDRQRGRRALRHPAGRELAADRLQQGHLRRAGP